MATKVSSCIQDAIISGTSIMDYGQAIGYTNLDAIKATKDIPLEEFGISVDTAPSDQDQQDVIDALALAIQAQMIRPSVVAFIKQEIRKFPARAAKMLAIEERKFMEQKAKEADARSAAAANANAEAGKAVEQAKVMTINAEWDRKDAHATLEFRHDQGLSHQEYLEKARIEFQKAQAKKEQIALAMQGSENQSGNTYESKDMPKASGTRMPAMPVLA